MKEKKCYKNFEVKFNYIEFIVLSFGFICVCDMEWCEVLWIWVISCFWGVIGIVGVFGIGVCVKYGVIKLSSVVFIFWIW